jgi:molecular chaperone DnaK
MTLIDVLPMSIGVGLPGGRFKKIIDRNTSLPHKRSYSIWTSRDDQEVLEIPVFQGENDRAEKNEYLGTLMVPDLPRGARGTVVFDVQFSLSAESILTVTAEQRGTARMVSATFSTQETPDGIRRRLEDHPRGGLDSPDVERKPAASGGLLKKLFGKSKTG